MKRLIAIYFSIGISIVMITSTFVTVTNVSTKSIIERDYWPTEGWLVSTPVEENMDPSYLEEMLQYIEDEEYSIDSVLLIRNGYLVYEKYFNGWNDTAIHQLFSVTKSFVSCLVGIAKEEGLLQLNQTLLSFFPDRVIENLDSDKQNITIEHLLTMSTGLSWVEAIHDAIGFASDDPVQYILDRPMVAAPGEEFNYNSGNVHLLSAILQNVTGKTTLAYAEEKLFDYLGIENYSWDIDNQGVYFGGHGLSLCSQDLARFGFLYLNNGTWDGDQIVPKDWVSASISKYHYTVDSEDYGYLFWLFPEFDHYAAQGFMGQRILIFPKYDFIAIVTSPVYSTVYLIPILVSDYLLPSLNEYTYTPSPTTTQNTTIFVLTSFLVVISIFYEARKKK